MHRQLIETTFLMLLLFSVSTAQPADEQSGLIKTARGVLLVWNEPGNYFTLEVVGKDVAPAEQKLLFNVDGKFLQVVTTGMLQFVKGGKIDDKSVLLEHQKWESDYISKTLAQELKVETEWITLQGGQQAISWSYRMPPKVAAGQRIATRQLHLAVVKRGHIFLLNTAVLGDDPEADYKQLLMTTLLTLKSSDKALSLQKASEQARAGN